MLQKGMAWRPQGSQEVIPNVLILEVGSNPVMGYPEHAQIQHLEGLGGQVDSCSIQWRGVEPRGLVLRDYM